MKFSISFKYSNVTFKNKETKETISYDTKAEGNTFTFDNVDEDVVLGIVKGIKDRKASQVFAYDDFRTNFINVMARNKCKELYDKLDKGGWKVEDIAISNITIKDLEFTKPTMNARETLTVESRKMMESSEFKPGDLVDWFVPEDDEQYGKEFGGEVFHGGEVYKKQGDVYEVSFGEEGMFYPCAEDLEPYDSTYPRTGHDGEFSESKKVNEDFKDTMHKENQKDLSDLIDAVSKAIKDIDLICNYLDSPERAFDDLQNVREKLLNALPSTKTAKKMGWNESVGGVPKEPVIFRKDRDDGEVIAFFPETLRDGSCNPGHLMSYAHNGQHSEASIYYYFKCKPCSEEEYADLLTELEGIYTDGLRVMRRMH